eukprot:m.64710 g.64710  ORF g.64710 m.64710 type:complete len:590 (+) comp8242_c0_seq1:66-1835(+)
MWFSALLSTLLALLAPTATAMDDPSSFPVGIPPNAPPINTTHPSITSLAVHPDIAILFQLYDGDHDGLITPAEAHRLWYATGQADTLPPPAVPFPAATPVGARASGGMTHPHDGANGTIAEEILAMDVDANRDGAVTLAELSAFASRFLNTAPDAAHPLQPQQVHLALADRTAGEGAVRITFVTVGNSSASLTARVVLGDGRVYHAVPSHYSVPSRWWQPQGWVGWIYSAVLTGLTPGQTYNYTCVTQDGFTTPVRTFTSPWISGGSGQTNGRPVSFATFGDTGTAIPFGYKVTGKLGMEQEVDPVDFVLQQGDISYAGVDAGFAPLNFTSDDEVEAIWDLYGRQIENISSTIPWMTGVGNHEQWYNFSSFRARYLMPQSNGTNGNFWYSFQYGNVHICSASSEHDYAPGSPQHAWIDSDLHAARNNPSVDWIFFSLHRPFLSSDKSEYNAHCPGAPMLTAIEPLLLAYGVDVTLTGHQHAYERVHPTVNGSVVSFPSPDGVYQAPTAPLHLMIGSSGAMQEEEWIKPAPVWSAKHFSNTFGQPLINSYGYGRVNVYNATHMQFSFVPVEGDLSDVFWIVKPEKPATRA